MNKSLFWIIHVLAVAAAIAVGLAVSDVIANPIWNYLGFSVVWGYAGVVVAQGLTYAILRRGDIVLKAFLTGWFVLAFAGIVPAATYRPLQLWRDGVREIDANDLAALPRQPMVVKLTGTWRYDALVHGTYKHLESTTRPGTCNLYTMHYCRVPVVGAAWRPGEPVLAISARCDERGPAETRTALVTLSPAGDASARFDLETRDARGDHAHGACTSLDATEPDLAALHFDAAHGFYVTSADAATNPIGMLVLDGVYLVVVLGFLLRLRRQRITSAGEA